MTAPYWSNGVATLHQADAREIPLPDGSVHCCITSPPYWGLRDYGLSAWDGGDPECGHVYDSTAKGQPDKQRTSTFHFSPNTYHSHAWPNGVCGHCGATQQAAGIGLEPALSDWLANIVAVSREVWRVLRDDGTYWLNLGDAYSGSSKGAAVIRPGQTGRTDVDVGGWGSGPKGEANVVRGKRTERGEGSGRWGMGDVAVDGLPAKNLMGQPWRAAFALQDDGWILRSAIVWHKPNPMPESVSDRPTSAYEMVFLLTKRAHYFYDAEAVREGITGNGWAHNAIGKPARAVRTPDDKRDKVYTPHYTEPLTSRNARNVWQIPTQGRPEAHFATFPDELPRRCILAGTSEHGVCADCGAPWTRATERGDKVPDDGKKPMNVVLTDRSRDADLNNQGSRRAFTGHVPNAHYETQTVGWQPTCECGPCEYHRLLSIYRRAMAALDDVWSDADPPDMPQPPTGECTHPPRIPATALDPFIGSGTTVAVAQQLGRHGIGLDLNPDYLAIAAKRLAGITLPMAI